MFAKRIVRKVSMDQRFMPDLTDDFDRSMVSIVGRITKEAINGNSRIIRMKLNGCFMEETIVRGLDAREPREPDVLGENECPAESSCTPPGGRSAVCPE
jgi:hypothetical protein